jgi:hypothetical protein
MKPISSGVSATAKAETSVLDRSLNCEARRAGIGTHHSGPDPRLQLLGQLLTGQFHWRDKSRVLRDLYLDNVLRIFLPKSVR